MSVMTVRFLNGLESHGLTIEDIEAKKYKYCGGMAPNPVNAKAKHCSHYNYFKLVMKNKRRYTYCCPGSEKRGGVEDNDHVCKLYTVDASTEPEYYTKCICGQTIKYNCYIIDEDFSHLLVIGNCCIKKFIPIKTRTCENCGNPHKNRTDNYCNSCRSTLGKKRKMSCDKCGENHRNKKINRCESCRTGKCDICYKDIEAKYHKCFNCKYGIPVSDIAHNTAHNTTHNTTHTAHNINHNQKSVENNVTIERECEQCGEKHTNEKINRCIDCGIICDNCRGPCSFGYKYCLSCQKDMMKVCGCGKEYKNQYVDRCDGCRKGICDSCNKPLQNPKFQVHYECLANCNVCKKKFDSKNGIYKKCFKCK